ncbi:MAG: branched-chain amino acid ABC transporter permease [Chloroflexi bacterium]|nr:branched-chain amino acid ABC transporter permease [Chloroflexota bacterium]
MAGRHGGVVVVLLVGLLAIVPPVFALVGLDYYVIVLTQALILGILALSADLAWGSTGIFTLGQAVFFGTGAYAVGMLAVHAGMTDLVLASVVGLAAGALAGVLVGLFLFVGSRVGELYVALVTLALGYAAEQLASGWDVLGSANGIPGVPAPTLGPLDLSNGPSMYYAILVLFALALAAGHLLNRSQFGLVMRAVRDDGERAEFLGYRRTSVQILVFTLTSGLAGMAGGIYALEEGFVSPGFLGVALSTQVLLWVVLGGRGTLIGPLLGMGVVKVFGGRVQEVLPQLWPVVLGALLLGTILYLPGGLLGRRAPRRVRRAASAGTRGSAPGGGGA